MQKTHGQNITEPSNFCTYITHESFRTTSLGIPIEWFYVKTTVLLL